MDGREEGCVEAESLGDAAGELVAAEGLGAGEVEGRAKAWGWDEAFAGGDAVEDADGGADLVVVELEGVSLAELVDEEVGG